MATLRDIKRRIKSVKNTQQITRAMKMVSAAKLRRAQEDIVAARPYSDKIKSIVASLAGGVTETHPLISKAPNGKIELVLLTSDRGLCGGFNTQLIRMAERFIREKSDSAEISLNVIGRRAFDHFKSRGLKITKMRLFGGSRPTIASAREVASEIIDRYLKDESGEVYIIYSEFKSALTQKPTAEKLLPITPAEDKKESLAGFLFEPSVEAVFESLLPKYVEVCVLRAMLENAASEHGARMTSMDSASRNAADMIGSLTLKYNRVRQAAITKELMEIIGGAEALKG